MTDDPKEAVANIRKHGYTVLTNVVPEELFERLRARIVDQAAAEEKAGVAYFDKNVIGGSDKSQRVWALHNKGAECRDFVVAPKFHEVAREMLGVQYQLSEFQATFIAPGSPAQVLHADQIWAETLMPVTLGITIVYALDQFTADNGATHVIPGSHIHGRGLEPDDIFVESEATIQALLPRNSALIIDTRVWHGAGANCSNDKRRAIILGFKRSWVRASVQGPYSVRPEVYEKFNDFEKTLFGFMASNVNRLEHHMEGMLWEPAPEKLVGELHLQ
jgi:ectoine hydroxylase-related dioxygenase (phytanoyl-CoA dioxygenase family)